MDGQMDRHYHVHYLHALRCYAVDTYDECCGKIDLFRVQNRVAHILPWWKCCKVYQTEGVFHERCSNSWLFWNQLSDCTSNRTNYTQFWRPKICHFFNLQQVNFHVTLVIWWLIFSYSGRSPAVGVLMEQRIYNITQSALRPPAPPLFQQYCHMIEIN